MDEVELKQTYNHCVDLINNRSYVNSEQNRDMRQALNLMLQMIWQLHENIQEMQMDDDE